MQLPSMILFPWPSLTSAPLLAVLLASCSSETSPGAGGQDAAGGGGAGGATTSTSTGEGGAGGEPVCVPQVMSFTKDTSRCFASGCSELQTRSDAEGDAAICSNGCDTDALCNGGSRCRPDPALGGMCRFPCDDGVCADAELTCINGFCDLP